MIEEREIIRAAIGPEAIIPLIFLFIIIVNVITQVRKRSQEDAEERQQEAQQRRSAETPKPAQPGRQAGGVASDLDRFLEELARQKGQQTPPARQTPPISAPRMPQDPVPQPRRPIPAPTPQSQHPAPQQRPLPTSHMPAPQPRPMPQQQRPAARPLPQKQPMTVKVAAAPKAGIGGKVPHTRVLTDVHAPMALEIEPSAIEQGPNLLQHLPKDQLKQAVALREILGPCRAMNRFGSLRR